MYLIFDTETTGVPHNKTAPITDVDNWPRLVQIAWQLHGPRGNLLSSANYIIRPDGFDIPFKAEQVHGISTKRAMAAGRDLHEVLVRLSNDLDSTQLLVGHNIEFDINILGAEFLRMRLDHAKLTGLPKLDTGLASTEYCQLPGGPGGKLKMPRLEELHEKLFGQGFADAHDASYDVHATAKSFFELIRKGIIKPADRTSVDSIQYEEPSLDQGNSAWREKKTAPSYGAGEAGAETLTKKPFVHLHVHSQFSVLQATPDVKEIVNLAREMAMPAVGLTDLGNMYGVFKFVREARHHEIKPVVGCEFFLSDDRKKLKFTKDNPDRRFNQVLIARNKEGYHNLIRLSSIGFLEGLYGLYPRIDKALVQQHRAGLIAVTGGLESEIPHLILHVGERQAEEAFIFWHTLFGEDFYVELNRHGIAEEDHVNEVLLRFAGKHKVKYFAANEAYYLAQADANAHDVLLCIKEGEFKSTPIGSGRGTRYGLSNDEFYFKSQEEMKRLFSDLPEAIETLSEIIDKVEDYSLESDVHLPSFSLPKGFDSQDEYLRHLTYEGAGKRYHPVTDEIRARIDFELDTLRNAGYPGYFLIVQDFTSKARELGVSVGPGRGSAAGSVVAYCTGITNVDPLRYGLLFERFLNPDRVSLPDIDIDFDDEGREKVLNYVIEKYGKEQVAQIITYGTLAAKSAIRDCARVMELPLTESNNLAKLVPERPGMKLKNAFEEVKELEEIRKGNDKRSQVLQQAVIIEGSLRNTGTHACGVIITPKELTQMVPVAVAKDSNMLVTQYDNSVVESAGLLKMDFLGLTTLSIIRTALANIRKRTGTETDIEKIPLDDADTYALYQRGETNGTFQFESPGMQRSLRQLKPDKFEDLIAMNALYRPGPMQYIESFINRKWKREPIRYDLPEMEEFLAETYGITVYQEQVMLLAQKLAGFTKGEADVLRKAIGKKQKTVLDKMKDKFIQGCRKSGHEERIAEKIWKDWESFAEYAFNKSHSTCYSLVAYQTAYLKAHHPEDYMAAVLTHSQSNLDNVTFFIDECRSMGINVLGPDLNESGMFFEVNAEGAIRFGLGAIKGAGESAVEAIIQERERHGPYKDIFDFACRVSQRNVTKKTFEVLALSGALECFPEYHRRQYVHPADGDITLIEKATRYAAKVQQDEMSAQGSLFGGGGTVESPRPRVAPIPPFGDLEKLKYEKEVIGMYVSGHPLDHFRFEIDNFCNFKLNQLTELDKLEGREIKVAGIVTAVEHRLTRTGRPFGKFTLEDYSGNFTVTLFGDDYLKYKAHLSQGLFLFLDATVARQTWGNQQLEFKVKSMDLLNDIASKRSQGLKIRLRAPEVNTESIAKLERAFSEFKGPIPVYVTVQDEQEAIQVELLSRKYRIRPGNDLVDRIRKEVSPDVEVKL